MQLLHAGNINMFQPVSIGRDEVEARVDTFVWQLGPDHACLLLQERVKLRVNVSETRVPAVRVVQTISISRTVHHGQTQLDAILFQIHLVISHKGLNKLRFSI